MMPLILYKRPRQWPIFEETGNLSLFWEVDIINFVHWRLHQSLKILAALQLQKKSLCMSLKRLLMSEDQDHTFATMTFLGCELWW